MTPRQAAFSILERLDRAPLDLQEAVDQVLSAVPWASRDRRFLTELAFGVARWRFQLDWVIRSATGRRIKDLDRAARTLLRLGVYQLLFTRVPPSAAVDETVRMAPNVRLKGFVNGVLRRVAEQGRPPLPEAPVAALGAEYALPPWLAGRWLAQCDEAEARALAAHANRIPPLTLRVAVGRIPRDEFAGRLHEAGIASAPTGFSPLGLRLTAHHGAISELPGFNDGLFYVQDEASQLVARLVDAKPCERVLDACAAPGGKATQLAEAVGERGTVMALEVSRERSLRLLENARRMRCDNLQVTVADAETVPMVQLGVFDRVLLDAPCSGLGVLNRHPEGKWWKDEALLGKCAERQRRLLARLADAVRPGGRLVYAVCSTEPEEGERVVTGFLADRPDFSVIPAANILGASGAEWTDAQGFFTTRGNAAGLDGFFAAHLVRNS